MQEGLVFEYAENFKILFWMCFSGTGDERHYW
jgi:hypothetical protein